MAGNGSAQQSVTGRIRLDVASFRADAAAIAAAAQSSTNAIAKGFAAAASAGRSAFGGMNEAARGSTTVLGAMRAVVQQVANGLSGFARNAISITRVRLQEWGSRVSKSFKEVGVRIRDAQIALFSLSAAAGVFAYKGIQAADSVDLLRARYRELTTSEADAAALMDKVGRAAAKVGIPLREAQKQFAGLVPQIREAGESIDDYIALSLRLSTLNKEEGIKGAVFAIREALSSGGTDLVSLVERFSIPKDALRDLVKSTGSFSEALDIVLNKQGATQVLAEKQARSFSNLSAVIRDNLNQILERAFLPVLESVRDGMVALNEALTNTPIWVVQVGGVILVVTGVFAGLVLILEKVVTGFVAVKAAALATAAAVKTATAGSVVASTVGAGAAKIGAGALAAAKAAGVTVGAVALGAVAGDAIVRGVGKLTGNKELENQDTGLLLKKTLVIAVKFLLDLVKLFGYAIVAAVDILQGFWDTLVIIFAGIKNALGSLIFVLGSAVNAIGGIVGQGQAGQGLVDTGNQYMQEARNETLAAVNGLATRQADGKASVDNFIGGLQRGFRDMLFPVEQAAVAAEDIATHSSTWRENIISTLNEYAEIQANEINGDIDRRIQLEQELASLLETATQEQLGNRIDELEREREAVVKLLPALAAAAEYSEDAAEKLAGYNARLKQIADELPQLSAALRAATQRALRDAGKTYAKEIIAAEKDRADKIKATIEDAAEAIADLDRDVADKRKDFLDKESEINDEYYDAALQLREDHNRRLLEIEEDFNRARTLAASKLDAAGVAEAINARKDALDDAVNQRDKGLGDAGNKLAEAQAALAQERIDLQLFYDERLQLIRDKQAEETQLTMAQYALARVAAQEKLVEEQALIQSALASQLATLKGAAAQYAADQLAITAQTALQERAIKMGAISLYLADLQLAADTLVATGKNMLTNLFATTGLSSGAANIAGQALSAGIGTLAVGAAPGLAPVFNIYGATDPLAVAEIVRQEWVRIFGGGG